MTANSLNGCNLISPYGRITKYVPLEYKGFFLYPRADTAPEGWTYDTSAPGAAKPGAPGGSKPYRFVSRAKTTGWYCQHTPGDFFYGEIDWVGPWKDEDKQHRGKWRLSFHGPVSRQFADAGFSYGSDSMHNNVYMEGTCVAVAPYPVLGAALREYVNADYTRWQEEGANGSPPPEYRKYVVVVTWDGSQDIVYRRPLSRGVLRREYSDEYRNAQMRLYDAETAPTGWETLATLGLRAEKQGTGGRLFSPKTPWFFSESGSRAACVRGCAFTMNRGSFLPPKEREGFTLFTLSVSDSSAVATEEGNDAGFTTEIVTEVKKLPDLVVETEYPVGYAYVEQLTHTWELFEPRQTVKVRGSYVVGCDFLGETLRRIRVHADIARTSKQHMYIGADPTPHPDATVGGLTQSNYKDFSGDWLNYEDLPTEDPQGVTKTFIAIDDKVYIQFDEDTTKAHWLHRRLTGNRTEFETGVPSTQIDDLYFVWQVSAFVHHLDARYGHYAVFTEERAAQQTGENEVTTTPVSAEQHFMAAQSSDYKNITTKQHEDSISYWTRVTGFTLGWPYAYLPLDGRYSDYKDPNITYAVGVEHTVEYVDVQVMFPDDLENDWPTQVPKLSDAYGGAYYTLDEGLYPLTEYLQSVSKSLRSGGFGADEFGNYVVSMEYRDHEDRVKYYNYISGSELPEVTSTSGNNLKFYPIGVS